MCDVTYESDLSQRLSNAIVSVDCVSSKESNMMQQLLLCWRGDAARKHYMILDELYNLNNLTTKLNELNSILTRVCEERRQMAENATASQI